MFVVFDIETDLPLPLGGELLESRTVRSGRDDHLLGHPVHRSGLCVGQGCSPAGSERGMRLRTGALLSIHEPREMLPVNFATAWAIPIVWEPAADRLDSSTTIFFDQGAVGALAGCRIRGDLPRHRRLHGLGRTESRRPVSGPHRSQSGRSARPAPAIADAIKLITKENIVPRSADQLVHILAPVLLLVSAFLVLAVVPFGLGTSQREPRPLQRAGADRSSRGPALPDRRLQPGGVGDLPGRVVEPK